MQQQLGGFFTQMTKPSARSGAGHAAHRLGVIPEGSKAVKRSLLQVYRDRLSRGEHKGLRFSAANVELRRTVEENPAPTTTTG